VRSIEEVRQVQSLIAGGLNNCAISRATGIPVTTVQNWRAGAVPQPAITVTCPECRSRCLPLAASQESAYAYLLGQYLGDGTITRFPRDVFRLAIYGDARYTGITGEIIEAVNAVMPRNCVGTSRHGSDHCVVIATYSRTWPCLFPQAGAGPKHARPIRLTDWQKSITTRYPRELIRGLIHSDGCRSINPVRGRGKVYSYPRYTFSNRSQDIKGIFCEHLDLLGIPWRRMNAMNISVARREGVARLDEFVGPKQ
jgi:hypothetical protein